MLHFPKMQHFGKIRKKFGRNLAKFSEILTKFTKQAASAAAPKPRRRGKQRFHFVDTESFGNT